MTQRALYIAAYDISDARRLRRALDTLKCYATGGQESLFECYLSVAERLRLIEEMRCIVDGEEDRFVLLRLEQRATARRSALRLNRRIPTFST